MSRYKLLKERIYVQDVETYSKYNVKGGGHHKVQVNMNERSGELLSEWDLEFENCFEMQMLCLVKQKVLGLDQLTKCEIFFLIDFSWL